jgi:hypothetical protein
LHSLNFNSVLKFTVVEDALIADLTVIEKLAHALTTPTASALGSMKQFVNDAPQRWQRKTTKAVSP